PEWIQYQNNWYQYASKYTADTPDGKDSGQFSATTSYTVTYQYQLRQPPEDFVLQKAVRNDTAGETEFKTETNGQNGDGVTYQLQ
ncbi:cell surface complex protein precursor, CscC family, partial [Lactiplantibacillus plantarum]